MTHGLNLHLGCLSRSAVLVAFSATFIAGSGTLLAADSGAAPADKTAAIRASAEAFQTAFNAGNAKQIAALWTPSGMIVDERGEITHGRDAIAKEYDALFKEHPGAHIEVKVESVDMPAPNLAVESGVATLTHKDAPPSASRYSAVHVLEGGQWLMATAYESQSDLPSDNNLQSLDWLIGKWQAKSDDAIAESNVRWLANKTFIERTYIVRKSENVIKSGKQVIGWDPQHARIRSWTFDSSGGYGSGIWSPTTEGWQIDQSGALPDGTPTSSWDFVVRVPGKNDAVGFRSTNRFVGQTALPDTPETEFDRVKDKP